MNISSSISLRWVSSFFSLPISMRRQMFAIHKPITQLFLIYACNGFQITIKTGEICFILFSFNEMCISHYKKEKGLTYEHATYFWQKSMSIITYVNVFMCAILLHNGVQGQSDFRANVMIKISSMRNFLQNGTYIFFKSWFAFNTALLP